MLAWASIHFGLKNGSRLFAGMTTRRAKSAPAYAGMTASIVT
jgi:hypothetical protein